MIKLPFYGEEQDIFYEKLDNGLEVYIVPNKNERKYLFELVSKFGANTTNFIPINETKYQSIPLGTAHFLEHKLFDTEKGDASILFNDLGLFTNASTSYYFTKYFVEGKTNAKRNLDYFLNVFLTPYFEKERVDSEKGIIKEEIDMYLDEADWYLYNLERTSLFNNVLQEDIAGTRETISEINPEILQKVYDVFYQPSNLFLVISGKVKPNEIMEIIKNNKSLSQKKNLYPIKIKKEMEPLPVKKEYDVSYTNVVIPKMSYNFKFDVNNFSFIKPEIFKIYLNILFYILFGDGSDFSEYIYNNKISNYFYVDTLFYENIYCVGLTAETDYADIFKDEIDKRLENIQIDKEDFIREIKIRTSLIIRELDNIHQMSNSIINSIITRGKYIDDKEILDNLNYEDFLKLIDKLTFDNRSFVMVLPKEKKS